MSCELPNFSRDNYLRCSSKKSCLGNTEINYGTTHQPTKDDLLQKKDDSKKVILSIHGRRASCCTVIKEDSKVDYSDRGYKKNSHDIPDDHCHRERSEKTDEKARQKLVVASILCLIFMIIEIFGGLWSNSLAIATDAAHLLTDFASFLISLFSIWVSSRPPTKQMSFGWYRAEVIGALISVLLIWVVTGVLVYLAIERLIHRDFELDSSIMLISSAFGVAVNLVMGLALHQHEHNHKITEIDDVENNKNEPEKRYKRREKQIELMSDKRNINVRAAFVHVLGDFIQSIGVFTAALVIYFAPTWNIVDPLCTFLFSILVVLTTVAIIKDVINILMEGIPKGFKYTEVENILAQIDGVVKIHNLRIWALSLDKTALSAHIAIKPGSSPQNVLRKATENIHEKYDLYEMTIQIEEFDDKMKVCKQCRPLYP